MKTVLTFCFFLFCVCITFSQQKKITVTNSITKKERNFKEGLRIRVKTTAGKKISGRLKIIDKETIRLRKHTIKLTDITKIKRHPLAMTIFTDAASVAFIAGFFIATAVESSINNNSSALYYNIPVISAISIGIVNSTNFLKGYKKAKHWGYGIVME